MYVLRLAPLLVSLVTLGATCNRNKDETGAAPSGSAAASVVLPGVDTESLTKREKNIWSALVAELASPCEDVAVPVAQCVKEKRECDRCLPAAKFVKRMVSAGKSKAEIAEIYEARFDPKAVKTIVLADSPTKGASDPGVIIVEFADFECGACGQVYPFLKEIYGKYGKKVRMVFKHFPLDLHSNAKLAAQAAYAAQKQGHFWKMHDLLFENQPRLTEPDLIKYAKDVGLDLNKFKKDMHSDGAKERWEKEKKQGESLGVSATPTIYINGRECDLTKLPDPDVEFGNWLDLELEQHEKRRSKPAANP